MTGRVEDGGEREGGSNSVVESQPSKLLVAGSIPVSRSSFRSLTPLASSVRRTSGLTRQADAGGVGDVNQPSLKACRR